MLDEKFDGDKTSSNMISNNFCNFTTCANEPSIWSNNNVGSNVGFICAGLKCFTFKNKLTCRPFSKIGV